MKTLSNSTLERYELDVFNHIQKHCFFRGYSYGRSLPRASGGTTAWHALMMRALMDPQIGHKIGCLFWHQMRDVWTEGEFQVAGLEAGAIPMVLAITYAGWHLDVDCNGFYVRKEKKPYGLSNWTEGIIRPGVPVLVVDDIANTKSATSLASTILTEIGAELHPMTFSLIEFREHVKHRSLFSKDHFSLRFGEKWEEGTYDESTDLVIQFDEDCTCGAPTPEECPAEWERIRAEQSDE